MQQRSGRGIWGTLAALLWIGAALAIAGIVVGAYVLPMKVAEWQAQGVRELPAGLEMLVDLCSIARNLGVLLLVPLLVAACVATALYVRVGAAHGAA